MNELPIIPMETRPSSVSSENNVKPSSSSHRLQRAEELMSSRLASVQRFVEMLSTEEDLSPSTPLQIQIALNIDGVESQLTIRKHAPTKDNEQDEQRSVAVFEYCITTRTPLRNAGESIFCTSVEDLMHDLEDWIGAKYVGRLRNSCAYASFMKRKDARRYDIARRAVHAMMHNTEPKVLTECYVCYEDTFGHRTVCGHDICPTCFYRSLKELEVEEESDEYEVEIREDMMFCPRTKFECGLCRQVERSYM